MINEMGWLPPSRTASHYARKEMLGSLAERTATMMNETMIGVDLAKAVFQ